MPVFDVFRIDEKHFAKVRTVRGENLVLTVKIAPKVKSFNIGSQPSFNEWKKYIAKKCNPKKHLTAARIERVFDETPQREIEKKKWYN